VKSVTPDTSIHKNILYFVLKIYLKSNSYNSVSEWNVPVRWVPFLRPFASFESVACQMAIVLDKNSIEVEVRRAQDGTAIYHDVGSNFMTTLWAIKRRHLYFYNNSGKCRPILIILSLILNLSFIFCTLLRTKVIKPTPPLSERRYCNARCHAVALCVCLTDRFDRLSVDLPLRWLHLTESPVAA